MNTYDLSIICHWLISYWKDTCPSTYLPPSMSCLAPTGASHCHRYWSLGDGTNLTGLGRSLKLARSDWELLFVHPIGGMNDGYMLFHIAMLSNLRRTTSQGVFVPIDNI